MLYMHAKASPGKLCVESHTGTLILFVVTRWDSFMSHLYVDATVSTIHPLIRPIETPYTPTRAPLSAPPHPVQKKRSNTRHSGCQPEAELNGDVVYLVLREHLGMVISY